MQPDVLNSRKSIPAREGRQSRRQVPILTPRRMGTSPLPLRPLARFRRPRWRGARGFRAGGCQGVVILIVSPGDLIEGARGCRKVVIVRRSLTAVHRGEGVARGFEGIHLLVLEIGIAQTAVSRCLGAVAPRQYIAGLLEGVVVHGQVMFSRFGKAVEALQLSTRAV